MWCSRGRCWTRFCYRWWLTFLFSFCPLWFSPHRLRSKLVNKAIRAVEAGLMSDMLIITMETQSQQEARRQWLMAHSSDIPLNFSNTLFFHFFPQSLFLSSEIPLICVSIHPAVTHCCPLSLLVHSFLFPVLISVFFPLFLVRWKLHFWNQCCIAKIQIKK